MEKETAHMEQESNDKAQWPIPKAYVETARNPLWYINDIKITWTNKNGYNKKLNINLLLLLRLKDLYFINSSYVGLLSFDASLENLNNLFLILYIKVFINFSKYLKLSKLFVYLVI